MPTPDDLRSFRRKQAAPDVSAQLIQKLPPHPPEVLKRFPEMRKYDEEMEAWRVKTNIALRGGTQAG